MPASRAGRDASPFAKEALLEMLRAIQKILSQASAVDESHPEKDKDHGEVVTLVGELISQLTKNNYKAMETLAKIKKIIPASAHDEHRERLSHHVDNFQYREALEIAIILQNKKTFSS